MHANVCQPTVSESIRHLKENTHLESSALLDLCTQIDTRSLETLKVAQLSCTKTPIIEGAAANLLLLGRVLSALDLQMEFPDKRRFSEITTAEATGLAHLAASRLVYAVASKCDAVGPAQEAWFKTCQLINACGMDCKCAVLSLPPEKKPPRYVHDYDYCTNLGHFEEYDLYFCLEPGCYPTLIARYGNDGPEYLSARLNHEYLPVFSEARQRAKNKGLF